ncbi:MAG: hypothetical protein LAN71_04165 [Acidobacteriia bacterium]|nr:hypothetical protein [Terriglobia bacterium]
MSEPQTRTKYTYDSANRPSTAIDGSNGITYAAGFQTSPGTTCIANVACYTPQGTFYALSIGQTSTFTGLNLTHMYNSRLQPLEFKASSTGGNAIDITYSFVDPANSRNAGHVFSITNNLDSTRSQTFSYDQLNRITAAQTTSTYASSPLHCWGETYGVDAWGNLQSIAATTNTNYTGCSQESGFSRAADGYNHLVGFSYDLSGNTTSDSVYSYNWNAESQLKSTNSVNYLYDGNGRRVSKSNGKLYWYGAGSEILAETDAAGNTTAEYVFFGGKRIAMLPAGSNPIYYVEDLLGTSRVTTTNTGVVCYDTDFYPYGGERFYTNTCPQNNYKFEGKERDLESGNDEFGARYYSNRFGRWLSADWSAVPAPVPYANFTNPQTLNLYAMVSDDPESFADLDGHCDWCDRAWNNFSNSMVATANAYKLAATTTFDVVKNAVNETGKGVGQVVGGIASGDDKLVSEGVNTLGATIVPLVATEGLGEAAEAGEAAGSTRAAGSVGTSAVKEGIYEGADATAPGRTYVGQSGNVPERLAQHEASGKFPGGTKVSTTEVKGGKTAREIAEQKRLNELGGVRSNPGSTTSNQRNPIGKKRKKLMHN